MQELEITGARVRAVWWLITWRSLLGATIIGFAVGFVIAFLGAFGGFSIQAITYLNTIIGGAIGLAWGFIVVRMALHKQYGDFRIALVPRHGS